GCDHLALQPHAVEVEHAHSAVAVLVQATHELNRHSFPDVHLERVVLHAKFELPCLDRLPELRLGRHHVELAGRHLDLLHGVEEHSNALDVRRLCRSSAQYHG
ncbi:MAG: hypothetical protein ACK55Z_26730, partial [bacterium]